MNFADEITDYEDVRNALARLAVRCAQEAQGKHRSGPKPKGWKAAGRILGIQFQTLQKVCWGQAVRPSTVAKVRDALVAAGELQHKSDGGRADD